MCQGYKQTSSTQLQCPNNLSMIYAQFHSTHCPSEIITHTIAGHLPRIHSRRYCPHLALESRSPEGPNSQQIWHDLSTGDVFRVHHLVSGVILCKSMLVAFESANPPKCGRFFVGKNVLANHRSQMSHTAVSRIPTSSSLPCDITGSLVVHLSSCPVPFPQMEQLILRSTRWKNPGNHRKSWEKVESQEIRTLYHTLYYYLSNSVYIFSLIYDICCI